MRNLSLYKILSLSLAGHNFRPLLEFYCQSFSEIHHWTNKRAEIFYKIYKEITTHNTGDKEDFLLQICLLVLLISVIHIIRQMKKLLVYIEETIMSVKPNTIIFRMSVSRPLPSKILRFQNKLHVRDIL